MLPLLLLQTNTVIACGDELRFMKLSPLISRSAQNPGFKKEETTQVISYNPRSHILHEVKS